MSHLRNLAGDFIVDTPATESIIKPYVISHGTMECRNLHRSKQFYEQVLGLECVVHSPSSMIIRCGTKFHITAVEVGESEHEADILQHWGLDLPSQAAVDEAHAALAARKDELGIKQLKEPMMRHGVYSFYLQDFDSNWWEIEFSPGFLHDDIFDFGDRYELQPAA